MGRAFVAGAVVVCALVAACSTSSPGRATSYADASVETSTDGGAALRWQTVELTCTNDALVAAGNLPAGFVVADIVDDQSDVAWLNDHAGEESGIDADAVRVDCTANGFPSGTHVAATAGYRTPNGATGTPLRWVTYDYLCPKEDGLAAFQEVDEEAATGVEPGFVVASYTIEQNDIWYLAPSTGWKSTFRKSDGTLRVRCGNGNGHPAGTAVRIALGYPDDKAPEPDWVTYRFTCPPNDVKGELLVDVAENVRTTFIASTFSVKLAGSSRWSLKTRFGMASRIEGGRLRLDCGTGGGLGPGTEVLIGFAYR